MDRTLHETQVYEIEPEAIDGYHGAYVIVPQEAASAWDRAAVAWDVSTPAGEQEPRPDLVPFCNHVVANLRAPRRLARGSDRELRRRLERAMLWARRHFVQDERSSFEVFAPAVARVAVRRFLVQFSPLRLCAEEVDQWRRDKALTSDRDLVEYLEHVRQELHRAQRLSKRFGSATERPDDLIADTITRIIEIVRLGSRPYPFAKYERPGLPAYLLIYDGIRTASKRLRRITLVGRPGNLPLQTCPSPEEILLEREARATITSFPSRVANWLTRRQERWLQAFLRAADGGGGVLSRAASDLGVHKSQATRAAAKIASVARRHRILGEMER